MSIISNFKNNRLFVVGIRATIREIGFLQKFLETVPSDPGIAFILIDLLFPEKNIQEIIRPYTTMSIKQMAKPDLIEKNHIYIVSPDNLLLNENKYLAWSHANEKELKYITTDYFFRSLGKARGNYSAGVIFSGSEFKNLMGLKSLKKNGGLVVEQQSVKNRKTTNGLVNYENFSDWKLPVEKMGEKLVEYQKNLHQIEVSGIDKLTDKDKEAISQLIEQINSETGYSFKKECNQKTLLQIKRRMLINGIQTFPDYLAYTNKYYKEIRELFRDLTNSTNGFFSDAEGLRVRNRELESKFVNPDTYMRDTCKIATVVIDKNFSINSFTDKATDIFNLYPAKKEQTIEHLSHRLDYDMLQEDMEKVFADADTVKKTIYSTEGRKFIMKISPCYTSDKEVESVMLNFLEIDELDKTGNKVKEHAKHEDALAEMGLYALHEQDIQAIINKALDKICSTLDVDHSLVLESEKDIGLYSLLGSTTEIDERYMSEGIKIENEWDVSYALNTDGPFIIEEYQQINNITLFPLLEHLNITTGIYINIGGTEENFGILGIYSREKRTFEEHELNFIQIIANILGSVIERQRSKYELEVANKQLAEEIERNKLYQKEILNINIIERWNLGEYLHDNLGQTLVSAKIMLNDISRRLEGSEKDFSDEIDKIEDIIKTGLDGIRNLSHEIVPIDVETQGVIHAFKHMLKHAEQLHDVKCILETDEITDKIKNRELVTNLYRVAQEAVNNAILHGRAKNVKAVIIEHDKQLYLHIKDDGEVIEYSKEDPDELSVYIMKHRMELLGGTFRIKKCDKSDLYTNCITCTLPMEALEN